MVRLNKLLTEDEKCCKPPPAHPRAESITEASCCSAPVSPQTLDRRNVKYKSNTGPVELWLLTKSPAPFLFLEGCKIRLCGANILRRHVSLSKQMFYIFFATLRRISPALIYLPTALLPPPSSSSFQLNLPADRLLNKAPSGPPPPAPPPRGSAF